MMTTESKPEDTLDLRNQAATEVSKPEPMEFVKPLILPPPIPGQTAWSIVPW